MRVLIVRASAERRGSQNVGTPLADLLVLIGDEGTALVLDCIGCEMPLMTMPTGTRMERSKRGIVFRGPDDEALDLRLHEWHSEAALNRERA